MNATKLKAITRHGETLLALFPHATEQNPVALCKKLRRIENSVSQENSRYCNGVVSIEDMDKAAERAEKRVLGLLGSVAGLYINRDPRGYALKLDDAFTRDWNNARYIAGLPALYTDMGGYGILAPDLNA